MLVRERPRGGDCKIAKCGTLIESHTQPISSAPDDVAWQTQPVAVHNQSEFFGDADFVGDRERRSGNRQVADHAINSAASEFNHCGFRGAVARRDPSFDHSFEILQIRNESIKHRLPVALAELGPLADLKQAPNENPSG